MKNNMLIAIIAVVVVGGLAFFGGMKYQQSLATSGTNGQYAQGQSGQGRFGNGNRGNFQRPTVGQVVAQDANSITISLPDGSSKIINISSSTKFMKMDNASMSDVKVGDRVAAMGTTNSDGSVTAQSVQLNPQFGTGRGAQPTK